MSIIQDIISEHVRMINAEKERLIKERISFITGSAEVDLYSRKLSATIDIMEESYYLDGIRLITFYLNPIEELNNEGKFTISFNYK